MSLFDSYLRVNEAANLLGVHPETVKRLCQRGAIRAEKVHNTWLISKDEFDRFLPAYQRRRRRRGEDLR